mmetsp:Transcript_12900/g.21820  ORF Transcript_12900/g.21820 Transcript_12900/m.21820 type:complete len:111 (-) Transcript_12900:576-908(-)
MSSSDSNYTDIIFTKSTDGHIAYIKINRPKKLNSIRFETLAEIEKCVETEINPFTNDIRALIIYSEGKHFTSGIDLMSAAQIGSKSEEQDEDGNDLARASLHISEHVGVL